MTDIERYAVVDVPDGDWGDTALYDFYPTAKGVAACRGACVIAVTYEFSGTELVDDFRPQGT